MKTLLIIVVLALLAGGAVWYSGKQTPTAEAPAPTVTKQQTETAPTVSSSTANDIGMTAEERAAMMGESSAGTDVGMEIPVDDTAGLDHSKIGMTVDATAKKFDISGKNFAFDKTEIRVKKGDTVTINFTSADGFHDLVIDEFEAKTERVRTGGTSAVTFVADKTGTFEYYCSVGQHRMNGMVGKLIVE